MESIKYADFPNICRFCLKNNLIINLKPIIVKSEGNDKKVFAGIDDMITAALDMQISISDGLPQFICTICLDKLLSSYIFRIQCTKSITRLKLIKDNYDNQFKNGGDYDSGEDNDKYEDSNDAFLNTEYDCKILNEQKQHPMNTKIKTENQSEEIDNYLDVMVHSDIDVSSDDDESLNKLFGDLPNKKGVKSGKHLQITDVKINGQTTINNNIIITNNTKKLSKPINNTNNSNQKVKPKRIHKRRPSRLCEICGVKQRYLDRHLLVHTGEKRFECAYCKNAYTQFNSLKSHLNTHFGYKPYHCTTCDKVFNSPLLLKRHQVVHLGIRKFACTLCDKSYIYQCNLNSHLLGHAEDRRHECEYCEKKFLTAGVLKKHILYKHIKERSFVCRHCGKAFITKWNLTAHERTHANPKIPSKRSTKSKKKSTPDNNNSVPTETT